MLGWSRCLRAFRPRQSRRRCGGADRPRWLWQLIQHVRDLLQRVTLQGKELQVARRRKGRYPNEFRRMAVERQWTADGRWFKSARRNQNLFFFNYFRKPCNDPNL
jgi:hypothetical protein